MESLAVQVFRTGLYKDSPYQVRSFERIFSHLTASKGLVLDVFRSRGQTSVSFKPFASQNCDTISSSAPQHVNVMLRYLISAVNRLMCIYNTVSE